MFQKQFQRDKLVFRKIYLVVPPKVEYGLTPRGKSLEQILRSLDQWGLKDYTKLKG
ncbi:MAG: winged helix-turn-helix transcriptional regulator [Cellulophaga sp.]